MASHVTSHCICHARTVHLYCGGRGAAKPLPWRPRPCWWHACQAGQAACRGVARPCAWHGCGGGDGGGGKSGQQRQQHRWMPSPLPLERGRAALVLLARHPVLPLPTETFAAFATKPSRLLLYRDHSRRSAFTLPSPCRTVPTFGHVIFHRSSLACSLPPPHSIIPPPPSPSSAQGPAPLKPPLPFSPAFSLPHTSPFSSKAYIIRPNRRNDSSACKF